MNDRVIREAPAAMRSIRLWTTLLALAGCGCVVSGCSSEVRVDVAGKVTYNGSPLDKPGGQIVFGDAKGTQVSASIGSDGAYVAKGVAAGPNRVAVYFPNQQAQAGAKKIIPKGGKAPPPQKKSSQSSSPYLTPIKYASFDTSELVVQVEPGTTFNVPMTGPAIPTK
jgi:hypothetical protein